MRSLWFKIFLWFWLAMAAVGAVLVVSIFLTTSGPQRPFVGPMNRNWQDFTGKTLEGHARRSVEILEKSGDEALESYLREIEKSSGIRAALFSPKRRRMFGGEFPRGARQLAARARRSGVMEFQPHGPDLIVALTITGAQDNYTMVGSVPRPFRGEGTDLLDLLLRFAAVLVTGGAVCYGLARYLTSPLSRLQTAVRELADGNLRSRVGPVFQQRRDEFADLGRDFDQMADRIGKLLLSQRRLLSDISHELRSPLTRLNVAVELARNRAEAPILPSLDRIEREAARMNDMIGQLLHLSRLEEESLDSPRQTVSLASLLQEITADASYEAQSRNRTVALSALEECAVSGSTDLLRSAIENVIRNAVRYTADGTSVDVQLRKLEEDGESWALISVRDHGPGVPENALTDVFRPFYRVGDARDRQTGGTGLGLAIASRIVEHHGGRIRAENVQNDGLEVRVQLPLKGEMAD